MHLMCVTTMRNIFMWGGNVKGIYTYSPLVHFRKSRALYLCRKYESDIDYDPVRETVRRVQRFKNNSAKEEVIKEKVTLLTSLGCSIEQINECPFIATLSEASILQRFCHLKDSGCDIVTVYLLLNAKKRKGLIELAEMTKGYGTKMSFIKHVFQCNDDEWIKLNDKYKKAKWPQDLVTFKCKVDLLLGENIRIEDIRNCLSLFSISHDTLRYRIDQIKSVHEPLLDVKNLARTNFEDWLSEERGITSDARIHKDSVRDFKIQQTDDIIAFLISVGYSLNDITSQKRLFSHGIEEIKIAWNGCKDAKFTDVTLKQLVNILDGKSMGKPSSSMSFDRKMKALTEILCCDESVFRRKRHLLSLRHRTVEHFCEITSFLESWGFDKSHVAECPSVLQHDASVLARFLQLIADDDSYKAMIVDKVKHLNLVEYYVEFQKGFVTKIEDKEDH